MISSIHSNDYNKKDRSSGPSVSSDIKDFRLCSLYETGTKAACADLHCLRGAVNNYLDAVIVGLLL